MRDARRYLPIGAAAGALFCAAPLAALAGDWPQFGRDPGHTGFNRTETVLTRGNVGNLREAWHISTGVPVDGLAQSAPAVQGGIVYLSANDGTVHARDAADGRTIWSARVGQGATARTSSVAVAGGSVYAVSGEGTLHALDAATGESRWTAAGGELYGVNGSPTVVAGVVYVTAQGFRAFDMVTGRTVWARPQSSCAGPCSPAVAGGAVYVQAGAASGRRIFALDAGTGDVRWSFRPALRLVRGRLDFSWGSTPAVAGGRLYTVGARGWRDRTILINAFGARTGARRWQARAGRTRLIPEGGPAVAGSVVYYASPNGRLYAFHAATGKQRWTARLGGATVSSPAVANGVVYVGGGTRLDAVDARSGKRLWSTRTTGELANSAPVVADGAVYVVDGNGMLYRFDLGG